MELRSGKHGIECAACIAMFLLCVLELYFARKSLFFFISKVLFRLENKNSPKWFLDSFVGLLHRFVNFKNKLYFSCWINLLPKRNRFGLLSPLDTDCWSKTFLWSFSIPVWLWSIWLKKLSLQKKRVFLWSWIALFCFTTFHLTFYVDWSKILSPFHTLYGLYTWSAFRINEVVSRLKFMSVTIF